jgi:MYXO-CTERM domain-containing protein
MIARRVLAGMVVLGALIVTPGAAAKAFSQGDVSLCSAQRCLPVTSQPVLNSLAAFYYDGAERPVRTFAPIPGISSLKLEFANGYVSGVVGGSKLDRFRSGGVNLDQFHQGVWYRLPTRIASGLRILAVALTSSAGTGSEPSAPIIVALAAMIGLAMLALGRHRFSRARTPSTR